ncbi:MAG: hypothetical protein LBS72_08315 [Oscillospiraceae bacterium]|jgi:hypothetical protein|nr:hypothetical protein [Oscillospiraceae bacterium]
MSECRGAENNAEFTNAWSCRCHIDADPPLPKRWPDPYKGTRYENDPRLCYGIAPRPFQGCGYPFNGVYPGQYGIWGQQPHTPHYPWENPDWPCPPKFEECCHYDDAPTPSPPAAPKGEEMKCFKDIPDGTVLGRYSPCCCSEYSRGCDPACPDTDEETVCGCWPRKEIKQMPFCQIPDGDILGTACPPGADYSISDIALGRKNGANVQELCGGMNLYTRRNSKYTLCGGYKLIV